MAFLFVLVFAAFQAIPILASTDPAPLAAPLDTLLLCLLLLAEPAALLHPVLTASTLLAPRACLVNLAILTLLTQVI